VPDIWRQIKQRERTPMKWCGYEEVLLMLRSVARKEVLLVKFMAFICSWDRKETYIDKMKISQRMTK
jgi:hypothetical protein